MLTPPIIKPIIPLPANAALVFQVDAGAGETDSATGNLTRATTPRLVAAFLQPDTRGQSKEQPGGSANEQLYEGYLLVDLLNFRLHPGSVAQATLKDAGISIAGEFRVTQIGHAFTQVAQGSGIPVSGSFKRVSGTPERGRSR